MGLLQKEKNRNAAKARNSFVTRKVEKKLTHLTDIFKSTFLLFCDVVFYLKFLYNIIV